MMWKAKVPILIWAQGNKRSTTIPEELLGSEIEVPAFCYLGIADEGLADKVSRPVIASIQRKHA
jgi:hypothetical protein